MNIGKKGGRLATVAINNQNSLQAKDSNRQKGQLLAKTHQIVYINNINRNEIEHVHTHIDYISLTITINKDNKYMNHRAKLHN